MPSLLNQRLATLATTLLCAAALSACSGTWRPSMPIANGNYIPDVNLQGEALMKYHSDVAVCQRQLIKHHGDQYGGNNAVAELRRCLIDKGYVLLS